LQKVKIKGATQVHLGKWPLKQCSTGVRVYFSEIT